MHSYNQLSENELQGKLDKPYFLKNKPDANHHQGLPNHGGLNELMTTTEFRMFLGNYYAHHLPTISNGII